MFCPNCGNQVIEGKKFCMSCGEKLEGLAPEAAAPAPEVSAQPVNAPAPEVSAQPVNVAAPAPEVNPTPVSQPVYTANPASQPQIQYQVIRQKPKSHAWIIVLVIVLVLAIAGGVTLLILKPWDNGSDSGYSSSEEDDDDDDDKDKDKDDDKKNPDSDNGGEKPVTSNTEKENTPVVEPEKNKIPSKPTLTVNGENIPLNLSEFAYGDVNMGGYGYAVAFIGGKGTELYGVYAIFSTYIDPNCPSANTTYDALSSEYIDIEFAYMDSSKGTEFYAASYRGGYDRAEVIVGDFKPNEKMEISVSGKASDDGLTFEFSASGDLKFYHDSEKLSDEIESIVDSVRNSGNNSDTRDEVEIGGETYPVSTTFIDLSNKGLYDKDIEDIKYLTNLTRAELSGNNLTDISVLGSIKSLEEIDATDNYISDISFMKNLPKLKIVVMNNNPISDISVFKNFTTIEKIWLNDTYVTNISPISGNKGLVELGFDNCNIKDISAIKGMNKLGMLSLNNCGVTDISALSSCTELYFLNIANNNITDFSPVEKLNIAEFYCD